MHKINAGPQLFVCRINTCMSLASHALNNNLESLLLFNIAPMIKCTLSIFGSLLHFDYGKQCSHYRNDGTKVEIMV